MLLILPALTNRPSLVTGCHSFSSFLPRQRPRPRPRPRPRSPPRDPKPPPREAPRSAIVKDFCCFALEGVGGKMWSAQEQDAAVGVGDTGTFWPRWGG